MPGRSDPNMPLSPMPNYAARLDALLKRDGAATQVLHGAQALVDVASADGKSQAVSCAPIVGAAGCPSALAAAQRQNHLSANKETLVVSGALFMKPPAQTARQCCPSIANTTPFSVLRARLHRSSERTRHPFDYPDRFRRPVSDGRFRHRRSTALCPRKRVKH